MSTSLFYHGFGFQGYRYIRSEFSSGQVFFTMTLRSRHICWPVCKIRKVVRRGVVVRHYCTLPIGNKPVWIVFAIQRVWCSACGLVRQVRIDFADPRRSYMRAFERYALEICRHMTIKDVANHLGVSWDLVKDIKNRYLQKRFSHPKLKHLKKLAIDKICTGAGHRYLTIVLDIAYGALVFVGDGKGADALKPFLGRLKCSAASVEAVAIDISPAHIQAIRDNLSQAEVVFDHFHVIKLYNDQLSNLRRQLFNQIEEPQKKQVIKGTRWLLMKNLENLNPDHPEPDRLQAALELNGPLATAFYMKEDLRQIWDQPDKKSAKAFLANWVYRAASSMIHMLKKMARTIAFHCQGFLTYYDYRISTGRLKGTNNKIKTMIEQA